MNSEYRRVAARLYKLNQPRTNGASHLKRPAGRQNTVREQAKRISGVSGYGYIAKKSYI